jgi:hypothetical protein
VGDAVRAFDWDKHPVVEERPAKTSAEAVGGTAEEAAQESKMPAEGAAPSTP